MTEHLSPIQLRKLAASGRRLKAYTNKADAKLVGGFFRDLSQGVQKYGNESVNAQGGFVVPDVLLQAVADLRDRIGIFRALAQVIPMTSDVVRMAKRTSGTTAYYVDENTSITESQAVFDQITLSTVKLASIVRNLDRISRGPGRGLPHARDRLQPRKRRRDCGLGGRWHLDLQRPDRL